MPTRVSRRRPRWASLLLVSLVAPGPALEAGGRAGGQEDPTLDLRQRIADKVALLGAPVELTGIVYGLHGVSASSAVGAAGLVGESTATTGATIGVHGIAASPDGAAGLLENAGGGILIEGLSDVSAFAVDGAGAVTAASFVGDGSGLTGGPGLGCSGCVSSSEIVNGAISADHLKSDSVGQAEILDGAVTAAKFAPGAVGASELAVSAVGTAKLADGDVTASKIAFAAVGSAAIADGTVTSSDVDLDAVSKRKFENYTVWLDAIYSAHDDCQNAGQPVTPATCASVPCQFVPSVLFLDCAGNCTEAFTQVCDNTRAGWRVND